MQNKHPRLLFISTKKNLLLECRNEFRKIYKFYSDADDFSVPCTIKNLSTEFDISENLIEEFVYYCESIRVAMVKQIGARRKNTTMLENLLAQIRFIRLRFLI